MLKPMKEKKKPHKSHINKWPQSNSWFLNDNLKDRIAYSNMFQVLEYHDCQPRLLYPTKLSAIVERERKTYSDLKRLKEFISSRK